MVGGNDRYDLRTAPVSAAIAIANMASASTHVGKVLK